MQRDVLVLRHLQMRAVDPQHLALGGVYVAVRRAFGQDPNCKGEEGVDLEVSQRHQLNAVMVNEQFMDQQAASTETQFDNTEDGQPRDERVIALSTLRRMATSACLTEYKLLRRNRIRARVFPG